MKKLEPLFKSTIKCRYCTRYAIDIPYIKDAADEGAIDQMETFLQDIHPESYDEDDYGVISFVCEDCDELFGKSKRHGITFAIIEAIRILTKKKSVVK